MNFDFLSPIPQSVLDHNDHLDKNTLGQNIRIHSHSSGIPPLDGVKIAIVGVLENRNTENLHDETITLSPLRQALYQLFWGNWHTPLADLGNIHKGATVQDTYFALKTTVNALLKKNIIPLVIGGSQDLTYPCYRAYDNMTPMVNVVNVDSRFDLGDSSKPISDTNFVGKIILDEPYNLFNYTGMGYQTYFNSQEEIDLMQKLYFETYRLGNLSKDISIAEPAMRDANLVTIDLSVLKNTIKHNPNGLDSQEICAITRYAGISNKVSSLGIYGCNTIQNIEENAMRMAQMIWYFIEGVNQRVSDDDFSDETSHTKYITLIEDQTLTFYKSTKTGRWWIEIPFLETVNNKLKRHTLLPCTHQDYLDACSNTIPERWYKAVQKNGI